MTIKARLRLTGVAAALLLSLAVARADAATCDPITDLSFQQANGSPGEALVLYCNNTFYMAFIGSPTTSVCNVEIGTALAMQSIALAARIAGRPLTVNFTDQTCVNKTIHIINSVKF